MSSFDSNSDSSGQASLGFGTSLPNALMSLLVSDDIQPGSAPSYEVCKTIYTYHPLGAKMAEKPIDMAQSQEREITIPGAPAEELVEAFKKEWHKLGGVGTDTLIKNVAALSRVYGVSSVAVIAQDESPEAALDLEAIYDKDLYFNILDPLNTAGSLTLNQNPNATDFQKPRYIQAGGQNYHPSRTAILMNEQPVYIQWTNSAFGYVGRSVYQRALYPLKSYVQSMITDNAVTEKAALLVAKLKAPGAVIDQRTRGFFSFKREQIKGGKTGNVLSIGIDESVESIDLKNVKDAAEFARDNILKNIATAAKMPASLINDETLAEGFGEGSEDAKQIARYVDGVRNELKPIYNWFDNIVMRRAWNPTFYAGLQKTYPELASVPYETAFYQWKNAFEATWPNLLEEPDSEKVKVDDTVTKAAIAAFEVLVPVLDPENKATAAMWLADVLNSRNFMFSQPLELDGELIASYEPPVAEMREEKEPKPIVESSHE